MRGRLGRSSGPEVAKHWHGASLTPREIAKELSRGGAPERPLLLPVVFSLGAKVENVPLESFVKNPTKIVSALRQMRGHLRADGVACYFDSRLEIEALGSDLRRSTEEQVKSGRIPIAAEVIRRMNALPQREFLLMAGVTGPMTLSAQMLRAGHDGATKERDEDALSAAQELAGAIGTQVATAFLEAGADTIIIHEEALPEFTAESCQTWANLVAPTVNVARFYEALPVLVMSDADSVTQNWNLILQQRWDCVVCAPLETAAPRQDRDSPRTTGIRSGIVLAQELFAGEGSGNDAFASLRSEIARIKPDIITTAGDVPFSTDMKRLTDVFSEASGVSPTQAKS
jgi:hypothetical protein